MNQRAGEQDRETSQVSPPRLLPSVDEITPEWIQAVFDAAGTPVPRVTGVANEAIGHGNMSDAVVTHLAYADDAPGAPGSVVCKFTSRLPVALALAEGSGAYRREVMTYRLLAGRPSIRTPRVYFAETDATGSRLNLVMEDLSAFAEPGDQIAGCSPRDAGAAIAEFAALHAAFWRDPAVEEMDWLFSNRPRAAAGAVQGFAAGARVCLERFGDRLPGEVFAAIDAFAPQVGEWAAAVPRRKTLIHREARVDNVVFDRRDPDRVRAYVIDWQFTSCGDPQYDIAYLASGSLEPQDRRACEAGLVEAHVARIREIDPGYTLDEAREAYRFFLPSGLLTTLSAALVLPPGEHEDLLLMTLLRRNVAALVDWEWVKVPGGA